MSAGKEEVTLFQFNRWRFTPNQSGPCMKVELFLRLAKIPHKVRASSSPGPTGSWPYIEYKGKKLGDSWVIIQFLTQEFNVHIDDGLSTEQLSQGVLLRRIIEDHFYFCILRHYWVDHRDLIIKYTNFGIPNLLTPLLVAFIRRNTLQMLNGGMPIGELNDKNFQEAFLDDAKALATILRTNTKDPKRPFILGTESPTTYDCVVYSHLSASIVGKEEPSANNAAFDFLTKDDVVQRYLQRMRDTVYPDWDELLKKPRARPVRDPNGAITVVQAKCIGFALLGVVVYALRGWWLPFVLGA